jgi:ABC-type uncharacterized transport system permease subunit
MVQTYGNASCHFGSLYMNSGRVVLRVMALAVIYALLIAADMQPSDPRCFAFFSLLLALIVGGQLFVHKKREAVNRI